MKNKFVIASAFLAANSFSAGEIIVNDMLSFEGFVDMSYAYFNEEIDDLGINESDNSFRIDEVEISWLFDFEPITARVEIEYEENVDDLEVEQALLVYEFDSKFEGSAITVGRYASMLGFEAYEQPGLYQYTTAYGNSFSGLVAADSESEAELSGFLDSIFFPVGERYSQGVRYTFEDERTFFGVSIQDGTINYENRLGGDSDSDGTAVDDGGYGFEVAYKYKCSSEFSFFLGGSYEIGDGLTLFDSLTTGDTETYVINTYATYNLGAWIFAAELNFSETELDGFDSGSDTETESITGLIMSNYAYSENASVTGRISYADLEFDVQSDLYKGDSFRYTIAHNYSFMDNILLITEFSYTCGEFDTESSDFDTEELLVAAEIIFVF